MKKLKVNVLNMIKWEIVYSANKDSFLKIPNAYFNVRVMFIDW